MPIPTRHRLEYAQGYLALGLVRQASAELSAIAKEDRNAPEVVRVRIDVDMEARRWKAVVARASRVCRLSPENEGAWIAWAFALHELKRTGEARGVLLKAEPLHGTKSAVLQYNLACYACVLGDLAEARRRLAAASKMDRQWLTAALDDPDLWAMRDELAGLLGGAGET